MGPSKDPLNVQEEPEFARKRVGGQQHGLKETAHSPKKEKQGAFDLTRGKAETGGCDKMRKGGKSQNECMEPCKPRNCLCLFPKTNQKPLKTFIWAREYW